MRRKDLVPLGTPLWVVDAKKDPPAVRKLLFVGAYEDVAKFSDGLSVDGYVFPLGCCFFTEKGAWAYAAELVRRKFYFYKGGQA